MPEHKVSSKIAVVILAIVVGVILVAYLPNSSFSQVSSPFLPGIHSNAANNNSNHTIIHGNNNNKTLTITEFKNSIKF